jgi:hypothetical protein
VIEYENKDCVRKENKSEKINGKEKVIWIGSMTIFQNWRYTTTIHLV